MSDAPDELRVYAEYIRRIAADAVATLQDLTAGQLNWKTGEDGSNTMFAFAELVPGLRYAVHWTWE